MGKVRLDISMSLDGFIAGVNDSPEVPLGEGGERLHQWIYNLSSWREKHGLEGGKADRDSEIIEETFENTGAIIMGRRMYNSGKRYWGENPPFHKPVFVLTHELKDNLIKEGGTTFSFVSKGVEYALEQARAVADGKDVAIAGGANTIQQYLKEGFVDVLQIHLIPILLGDGIRLFEQIGQKQIELERLRVIESNDATHILFQVNK